MATPAPATEDHRGQLRALLVQAGEFVAALDQIAQGNPRREADVISQIAAWHHQLGTALAGIITSDSQGDRISVWEWCARAFEPATP
jgi:hypothetical protein